jgi:putative endonuclease
MSKPGQNTHEKGVDGEDVAAAHLIARGYRVLGRNVRLPGGEIDLVCLDGATLVFVEVKSRSKRGFGSALHAVDSRKRAVLRQLAADYAQIVAPSARYRFDVVALDGERIVLHRNAF